MSVLKENARLDKYLAQSLIKENEYTETYRVIDDNDNIYFLKLYILKKTPERLCHARGLHHRALQETCQ